VTRRLRLALKEAPETPRRPHSLPADCPVVPLGTKGRSYYYLDALGQLDELAARDHTKLNLIALFSPRADYLAQWKPRVNRDGVPTGDFAAEQVALALMRACSELGVWSPAARVRGRGAWLGRDGDLILHLGDALYVRGRYEPCGLRDELVYPVMRARPHPAEEPEPGGREGAAAELLDLFRTWSWRRSKLDPYLLLGWICAAIVGGALAWRPAVWITGDKGTGKTTLRDLIKLLLVDGDGILSTDDGTEAAVRQRMRHDSLPLYLDEAEAEDDNARILALVKLARIAASGGTIMRGGQDHESAEFTVRFATLYSSINHPPMQAQDRSRIAFLHLDRLETRRDLKLDPVLLGTLGRRLLRRMADRWSALTQGEAPVLASWQEELRARGFDHRGAAQFGVMLACADVALNDHPPDGETLSRMVDRLVTATDDERADELADWQRCLGHLTSCVAQHKWSGGEQRTIGTLIALAAGRRVISAEEGELAASPIERHQAQDVLATYGLRLHPDIDGDTVAIANDHRGLAGLFERTHWGARSGASGVWRQALLRVPGARPSANAVRFRGPQTRAVLVPLVHVLNEVES
jgi:hypothetical protein